MELRVVDRGMLEGVVPAAPLADGVLWDGARIIAIGPTGAAWNLTFDQAPLWARHGRRLYLARGTTLTCLDHADGTPVWQVRLDAPALDLAAAADGVDVLLPGALFTLSRRGDLLDELRLPPHTRALSRVGKVRWITTDEGLLRWDGDDEPRRLYTGVVRAVVARPTGMEALVDRDCLFREDEGVPMVWSFYSPDNVVLLPYGREDWITCDRATGANLRVVDTRRRPRWVWDGTDVRDVVLVAGRIVVESVSDEPTIGVLGPETPPLWLAQDTAIEGLHGDGDLLLVAHAASSRLLSFHTEA